MGREPWRRLARVTRYVCIHGHFYQPPRENPWLESVELQESAYPYHDWNARITAECYAQNAESRILDEQGRIVQISNNYAGISFNVGPTLLGWMQDNAPDVHDAIVDADRRSQARFGGHGSALAQPYNHLIMPLASTRDRRTQVRWGIADFRHRFGREPEGMWLPEAAVDTETLEVLADHGIAFTILEPHQAGAIRRLDDDADWHEAAASDVDTGRPYLARLPSGNEIAIFFYDGPISRAVAFEGLLADGARLADRLLSAAASAERDPYLVNIATDGESYGHHHRHGDMALAFALRRLEASEDVELTNYGVFLEEHPPSWEVRIAEDTSWSCAHGVERWRSDCGCADGGNPEWDQGWREPLRAALDRLRGELDDLYEREAAALLEDPWTARDGYIEVLLDRGRTDAFLARHAARDLDDDEQVRARRLLELQRHAMLMFTSCGWFFDDLSRIETIQVLRYAGRALQLARALTGRDDAERVFLDLLAKAQSNDPDYGDGRDVFDRHVRPSEVTLEGVGAHYAVSSLFEDYGDPTAVHCYQVSRDARRVFEAGDARLAIGRVHVRSTITGIASDLEYAVLHLGDHNIDGGIRAAGTGRRFESIATDLEAAFVVADFPETIRRLEHHFDGNRYSLRDLFRDGQRRILRTILDRSIEDARGSYRAIHRSRAPLMRYLVDLGVRLPRTFHRAAEIVVNDDLRRAFQRPDMDPDRVRALLADAAAWDVELDTAGLAHVLNATIETLTRRAARQLPDPTLFERYGAEGQSFLEQAEALIRLADDLPFEVDLWRAQNTFYRAVHLTYPELQALADDGDEQAASWVEHFRRLGDVLGVAVEAG
ncbi:MAG: DUF3536 domain-containing protein [Actinobacteria bacterium]|nr:DUF3536 domain-containing protein [Actinomycetota bacterium]